MVTQTIIIFFAIIYYLFSIFFLSTIMDIYNCKIHEAIILSIIFILVSPLICPVILGITLGINTSKKLNKNEKLNRNFKECSKWN